MNIAALNGRPVMVGTKLTYQDQTNFIGWSDEYLIVTAIDTINGIDYVGNNGGINGNISYSALDHVFEHYVEPALHTNAIKTYAFSHISDLLSVPDDKLDACLDELKVALRTVRLGLTAIEQNISEEKNIRFTDSDRDTLARQRLPIIVWQDDGKNKTQLNVNGKEALTAEIIKPQ